MSGNRIIITLIICLVIIQKVYSQSRQDCLSVADDQVLDMSNISQDHPQEQFANGKVTTQAKQYNNFESENALFSSDLESVTLGGQQDISIVFWYRMDSENDSNANVFTISQVGEVQQVFIKCSLNSEQPFLIECGFSYRNPQQSQIYSTYASFKYGSQWQHLAIWITQSGRVIIYLDGQLEPTYFYSQDQDSTMFPETVFDQNSFGGADEGTSCQVTIDDFRIYRRQLSLKEIKCLSDRCDRKCDQCNLQADSCQQCHTPEGGERLMENQCLCSEGLDVPFTGECREEFRDNCQNPVNDYSAGSDYLKFSGFQGYIDGPVTDFAFDLNGAYGRVRNPAEIQGDTTFSFWFKQESVQLAYIFSMTDQFFSFEQNIRQFFAITQETNDGGDFMCIISQHIENPELNAPEGYTNKITHLCAEISEGIWSHYIITITSNAQYKMYENMEELSLIDITQFYSSELPIQMEAVGIPQSLKLNMIIGAGPFTPFDNWQKQYLPQNEQIPFQEPNANTGYMIPFQIRNYDVVPMKIDDFRIYKRILPIEQLQCLSDNCDSKCQDCEQRGDTCTSCSESTPSKILEENCICPLSDPERDEATCACPQGFQHIENEAQCLQCPSLTCRECTATECTNCVDFQGQGRSPPPYPRTHPLCECPQGSYSEFQANEVETNPFCQPCGLDTCLTCSGHQICSSCIGVHNEPHSRQGTDCSCPQKYFSIDSDLQQYPDCQPCDDECLTCSTSSNLCDDFCDHKCLSCQNTVSDCIQCKGDREGDSCSCPAGKYDDNSSLNCQNCHASCQHCDVSQCIDCKGNRLQDSSNQDQCICPPNSLDHFNDFGIYDCSSCDNGPFVAIFTDDYEQILVNFYVDISIPNFVSPNTQSHKLCLFILEESTLELLGDTPQCHLDTQKQIIITLGRGPVILSQDSINFSPNKIKNLNNQQCQQNDFFTRFGDNVELNPPQNPNQPIIILKGPNSAVNLCTQVDITVEKLLNDGFRGMQNYKFSLQSTTAQDTSKLDSLLQNNPNKKASNFLQIPSLTLEEYSEYTFLLEFENFLNEPGTSTITIQTSNREGTTVKIRQNRPFIFRTWEQHQFQAYFTYTKCTDGKFQEQDRELDIIWEDITQQGNPIILKQGQSTQQQKQDTYQLSKYQSNIGQHRLQVTASLKTNPSILSKHYITYNIDPTPLTVYIIGGNRLQGYGNELIMEGVAKDLDLEDEQSQIQDIQITWECLNMNNNQQCLSIDNNLIQLEQNILQQTFPKKLFPPYNSFLFTFSAQKSQKSNQNTAILIIVENDLPSLQIRVPEKITSEKININDDISVQVLYEGDNINSIFFQIALVYKLETVATKAYSYKNFALKIWDLFSDFHSDQKDILLRVSMYDPQYFMPSQATIKIQINLPPFQGQISITPQKGNSVDTEFVITIEDYYDEDQPLQYKYFYYLDINDYQLEVEAGDNIIQRKNLLQDFSNQNQLTTFLPQGNIQQNFQLLFMVQVADNLGAVTNSTQIIEVKPQDNKLNQLQFIKDQILKTLQIPYQEILVLQLTILVSEIQQINCINDDKDSIFYCDPEQFDLFQEIVSQLYDLLLPFNSPQKLTSQSLLNQVTKSLNILLEKSQKREAIIKSNLDNILLQIDDIVQDQFEKMNSLEQNNLLNQGSNEITQQTQNINENIGKIFQQLDIIYHQIYLLEQNNDNNDDEKNDNQGRFLEQKKENEEEEQQQVAGVYFEDQTKVIDLTKQSVSVIQKGMLPNSDSKTYKGENIEIHIDKQTNQKTGESYFQQKPQIIQGFTDKQTNSNNNNTNEENNSTTNLNDNFDDSTNSSQQIYDSSQIFYKNNPYQKQKNFPYQNQTQTGQDIDIRYDNSSIQIPGIQKPTLQQFQKKQSPNTDKSVCIQMQVEATGKDQWKSSQCETEIIEIDGQDPIIECHCKDLSFTTFVEDVKGLFSGSTLGNILDGDDAKKILQFELHKSAILYIFLTQLGITGYLVYRMYLIDKLNPQVINQKPRKSVNLVITGGNQASYSPLKQRKNDNSGDDNHIDISNNLQTNNIETVDYITNDPQKKKQSEKYKRRQSKIEKYEEKRQSILNQIQQQKQGINTMNMSAKQRNSLSKNHLPMLPIEDFKRMNAQQKRQSIMYPRRQTITREKQESLSQKLIDQFPLEEDDIQLQTDNVEINTPTRQNKRLISEYRDRKQSLSCNDLDFFNKLNDCLVDDDIDSDSNSQSSCSSSPADTVISKQDSPNPQNLQFNQNFYNNFGQNQPINEEQHDDSEKNHQSVKNIDRIKHDDQDDDLEEIKPMSESHSPVPQEDDNCPQFPSQLIQFNKNTFLIDSSQTNTPLNKNIKSVQTPQNNYNQINFNNSNSHQLNTSNNNSVSLHFSHNSQQGRRKTFSNKQEFTLKKQHSKKRNSIANHVRMSFSKQAFNLDQDQLKVMKTSYKQQQQLSQQLQTTKRNSTEEDKLPEPMEVSKKFLSRKQSKQIYPDFSQQQNNNNNQQQQIQLQQPQLEKRGSNFSRSNSMNKSNQGQKSKRASFALVTNLTEMNNLQTSQNQQFLCMKNSSQRKSEEITASPQPLLGDTDNNKIILLKQNEILTKYSNKPSTTNVSTNIPNNNTNNTNNKQNNSQQSFGKKQESQNSLQKQQSSSQQQSNNNLDKNDDNDDELVYKDILKGIVYYHELTGIFYYIDKSLPRTNQMCLYYLKMLIHMGLTSAFVQIMTQIQGILLSLLASVFSGLPFYLLKAMMEYKRQMPLKIVALVVYVLLFVFIVFISLFNAAKMGLADSNVWTVNYSFTILLDIFMLQIMVTLLKLWLFRFSIGKDGGVYEKIRGLLEMDQYFKKEQEEKK